MVLHPSEMAFWITPTMLIFSNNLGGQWVNWGWLFYCKRMVGLINIWWKGTHISRCQLPSAFGYLGPAAPGRKTKHFIFHLQPTILFPRLRLNILTKQGLLLRWSVVCHVKPFHLCMSPTLTPHSLFVTASEGILKHWKRWFTFFYLTWILDVRDQIDQDKGCNWKRKSSDRLKEE